MLLGNFLQYVMFFKKSYKYFLVKSFVTRITKVNWVSLGMVFCYQVFLCFS